MTIVPARPRSGLRVTRGRLDLWLLTLPARDAHAAPLAFHELDEAERRRADSFRRRADRELYVAAHVALRRLLGAYLRTPAKDLAFSRADCPRCGGPHGRPVLAGAGPRSPHFSLSHSHGAVLVGVAGALVGVDIEKVPRAERVDVCAPALHPREQQELAHGAAQDRTTCFARLWARKEACLKGIGTGIGGWMTDLYVGDGGPGAPPRPDGWTVLDVPCGQDHAAAAAVRGAAPRTVIHRLPPEAVLIGGRKPDTGTRRLVGAHQAREEEHV